MGQKGPESQRRVPGRSPVRPQDPPGGRGLLPGLCAGTWRERQCPFRNVSELLTRRALLAKPRGCRDSCSQDRACAAPPAVTGPGAWLWVPVHPCGWHTCDAWNPSCTLGSARYSIRHCSAGRLSHRNTALLSWGTFPGQCYSYLLASPSSWEEKQPQGRQLLCCPSTQDPQHPPRALTTVAGIPCQRL